MTRQPQAPVASATPTLRPVPAQQDPAALTASVVQWYLEVRSGRRPVDQARGLLTPVLRRRIARRSQQRCGAPPVRPLVRTFVQQRDPHTWSAVALVRHRDTGRVTALSLQFRHDGHRWLLTELSAPEDGDPPTGDIRRTEPEPDQPEPDQPEPDEPPPSPSACQAVATRDAGN